VYCAPGWSSTGQFAFNLDGDIYRTEVPEKERSDVMKIYPPILLALLLALTVALTACGMVGMGNDAPTTAPTAANTPVALEPTEPAPATAETETPSPATAETETPPPSSKTVRMARATWNTGWFQAEIYAQLLEELDYTVDDPVSLSPEEFYPALADGEYDMWANGWFPLHKSNVESYEEIVPIGSQVRGGALQGYLIDKQTAEAEGITNLADLQNPAVAALFDQDGNGKADLIGCNVGWGCEAVIEHHLDTYDLRETVEHVQGEYADLMQDTIEHYEAGNPVLFYTWTPNWPLNELTPGEDVQWLEVPFSSLPSGDAAEEELTLVPDVDGCASNPCNLGYPLNDIRVVANNAFLAANPDARRLLQLVQIPLDDINTQNSTMFFGEDSSEDIRQQAENWIADHRQQVNAWLDEAEAWQPLPTLAQVRERGTLRCGIQHDLRGFGEGDGTEGSDYSGFNADFCRAVATAVMGNPDAVTFVPLSEREQFAAVSDGRVDVVFRNITWLATRDTGMNPPNSGIRVAFGPTIFHDGQRFLVRQEDGLTNLNDLAGTSICVLAGSPAEQNLVDQFAARGIAFDLQRIATTSELYDIYERGGCDAVTGDTSELVSQQAGFINPGDHVILNQQISREPHSPIYAEGDEQWADIVDWVVHATIYAEELGVNQENIDSQLDSDNPDIARLLGERGAIGERLSVSNDFAYQIVRQVGNYKDIYDRHLGPATVLNLERGPNKTWNSEEGPGGLLSAPPFR
jgi:glycine betaine/proline transport system substrate-binding protein